jgi:transposase InsO family protein
MKIDLADARIKLETWRKDYNENRPHQSLVHLTQAVYVKSFENL